MLLPRFVCWLVYLSVSQQFDSKIMGNLLANFLEKVDWDKKQPIQLADDLDLDPRMFVICLELCKMALLF